LWGRQLKKDPSRGKVHAEVVVRLQGKKDGLGHKMKKNWKKDRPLPNRERRGREIKNLLRVKL